MLDIEYINIIREKLPVQRNTLQNHILEKT